MFTLYNNYFYRPVKIEASPIFITVFHIVLSTVTGCHLVLTSCNCSSDV